jgi:phenylalanyl-tRNA synthetase beta chain
MKVSLNWVKEYLDFELPEIDEVVARIGSQLGAVEGVINLNEQYMGIRIVKIVSCEKLEGSDHLNVCMVDDGGVTQNVDRDEQGLVQVVTGAPNVRADLFVPWLPPGSVVPSSYGKDPFVLEARKLRGAQSNGMLASAKELAIGDSHEGILELVNEASIDLKPGADFAQTYGLNDYIIEIENKMFTHRPDCFGILGVARELAGIFGHAFSSPVIYKTLPSLSSGDSALLTVQNEIPGLVPRFIAQVYTDISVTPSSLQVQSYLSRVGIRPINAIVDITNYFMVLTGQPMHAYDYDKVVAQDPGADHATLIARLPHEHEKLTLLNGREIEPRPEAILIATATKAIGLGGVMGGLDTEVDNNTSSIILECATFDMYSIRRTAMAHGIFTDAVTRFNKGQSPLQNDHIIAWVDTQLRAQTGLKLAATVDQSHLTEGAQERGSLYPTITIAVSFINDRLGLALDAEAMAMLLRNVECAVTITNDELQVTAPFWRTDIELREDVVEEVARLYGFDHLPLELPRRTITPAQIDVSLSLKQAIRTSLARAGANEVLTYSFVHGKLLDTVTQNREQAFKLTNAISPELQYYRLHALPSLLDKIHQNIKAGYDEFALFELNKGHNLLHADDSEDGMPSELEFLDFVYTSDKKRSGAAYFMARHYLDRLAADFGLTLSYSAISEDPHVPVADPYDYTRSAYVKIVDGEFLGMVGELKSSITKALKLPVQTAAFTIGPALLDNRLAMPTSYRQLPKFPKVEQDICFKVADACVYQQLYDFIQAELAKAKPEHTTYILSPVDIYKRDDDQDHKQITFRLNIASYEQTLTDQVVHGLLETVAAAAAKAFDAVRV